jgi:hypothetical protein
MQQGSIFFTPIYLLKNGKCLGEASMCSKGSTSFVVSPCTTINFTAKGL